MERAHRAGDIIYFANSEHAGFAELIKLNDPAEFLSWPVVRYPDGKEMSLNPDFLSEVRLATEAELAYYREHVVHHQPVREDDASGTPTDDRFVRVAR